jgi:hypothetical protein
MADNEYFKPICRWFQARLADLDEGFEHPKDRQKNHFLLAFSAKRLYY